MSPYPIWFFPGFSTLWKLPAIYFSLFSPQWDAYVKDRLPGDCWGVHVLGGHSQLHHTKEDQWQDWPQIQLRGKEDLPTLLVGTPFYSCLITISLLTCLSAGKKRILSRTVPDNPEWSGSGNKFTQRHLCHFRGTKLYCFFCSTKSSPNLLTLTLCTLGRNLETNFMEARTCNLCQAMTLPDFYTYTYNLSFRVCARIFPGQ